jgi:hypothetical protein
VGLLEQKSVNSPENYSLQPTIAMLRGRQAEAAKDRQTALSLNCKAATIGLP